MCAGRRTARVGAQCYERDVKTWLALGAVIVVGATIAVVMLAQRDSDSPPPAPEVDRVVEDFRSVERHSIAAFNTALRRQRANEIDELELAAVIEREVLAPWRAMRARVAAAPVPPERRELYEVMNRYIAKRELAWQAYVAALSAASDAEARPHYDVYHQENAAAQEDAKRLGGIFRQLP